MPKRERYHLECDMIPPVEIRSRSDAQRNLVIMKKNCSIVYSNLLVSQFGGEVGPTYKTVPERILKGCPRNFHPDVYSEDDEKRIWTEIKSCHAQHKQPMFSTRQIANYAFHIAESIWSDGRLPFFQTGIFVYGSCHEKSGLTRFKKRGLVEKLAHETRGLVIIPSNLLFLLFLYNKFSERIWQDQTSSSSPINHQDYFMLKQRIVTKLLEGEDFLPEVQRMKFNLSYYPETLRGGFLHLEGLDIEKTTFRDDVYCMGLKVKPFPIVKYSNQDERVWAKSFFGNLDTILSDIGVVNLFTKTREEIQEAQSPEKPEDLVEKPAFFGAEEDEMPF